MEFLGCVECFVTRWNQTDIIELWKRFKCFVDFIELRIGEFAVDLVYLNFEWAFDLVVGHITCEPNGSE